MQISEKDQRLVKRALAVLEGAMRYTVDREPMTSTTIVRDFIKLRFAGLDREEFHVLYLDAQNRLIEAAREFVGTINSSAVYPREIVKRALMLNAVAVILSHNHPSGKPVPSVADRVLTNALKSALAQVDVAVIDHIIAAGSKTFSFAESGLI